VVDRGVAEPWRRAAGPESSRGEVVIRRTPTGWRVEGPFPALPTDTLDDLGDALVLADLLADGTAAGPRPPRQADSEDELSRLKASVRQLEHALASRVVVEQAIGVLSERWRVAPRDAFEHLRRVTRSHGLRIHDLAKLVIASSTDSEVRLPGSLERGPAEPPEPRPGPEACGRGDGDRRGRRSHSADPAQAGSNGGSAQVPATAPAPGATEGCPTRVRT
jgi:ANTAR domain